jgi:hypothetical protein
MESIHKGFESDHLKGFKFHEIPFTTLNPNVKVPAFAEAPARRTRLWQAGLRAGRQMPNEFQRTKYKISFSESKNLSFEFWISFEI